MQDVPACFAEGSAETREVLTRSSVGERAEGGGWRRVGLPLSNERKGVIKTTRGRREDKIVANQVTLNEQSSYMQE